MIIFLLKIQKTGSIFNDLIEINYRFESKIDFLKSKTPFF